MQKEFSIETLFSGEVEFYFYNYIIISFIKFSTKICDSLFLHFLINSVGSTDTRFMFTPYQIDINNMILIHAFNNLFLIINYYLLF